MSAPVSTMLLAAVLATVLAFPISAAEDRDPLEGTWMLNVEKSRFGAVPGPKGQLRTYAMSDGVEKMTARGVTAEGRPQLTKYEARYDGKDYDITGSVGGNKISLRRVDANTTEITQKRDGAPVIVATRRVSDDGRMLTVNTTGTLPDGRSIDAVMLFERQ